MVKHVAAKAAQTKSSGAWENQRYYYAFGWYVTMCRRDMPQQCFLLAYAPGLVCHSLGTSSDLEAAFSVDPFITN